MRRLDVQIPTPDGHSDGTLHIGTTGYCLGGRMSLIAAGGLGRKIAAAASFHGGRRPVAAFARLGCSPSPD